MPKKTTILIVILALITGILIFLAVRSDKTQNFINDNFQKATPTVAVVKPYANLSFSPPVVSLANGQVNQTVNITLDTAGKPVSAAQVELTYDPKVITNVKLNPPQINPLFGPNPVVLINSVDPSQGRISYAVGISASDDEKVGNGAIATLTFTINKFAGVPTSQIAFLPKSAVTTLSTQGSVLNTSTPLQITLTTPSAPVQ
jgi:hypothetical protein